MATLCAKDADKWGCNQWVREGKAVLSNPTVTAFDAFNQADTGDLSKTVAARNDQDTASLVSGCWWNGDEVAATLTKHNANGIQRMPDKENFGAVLQPISFGAQMSVPQTDVDMVQTLQAKNPMAVAFGGDIARSLTARYDSSPCADRGMDVVAVDFRHTDLTGDTAHTIQAKKTGGFSLNYQPGVMQAMQVRRLLPEECEKLQGFLPGYTNIPWRGKDESPDGPRYKALGNSMAVPVMRWIGERMNEVSKL